MTALKILWTAATFFQSSIAVHQILIMLYHSLDLIRDLKKKKKSIVNILLQIEAAPAAK